MKIQSIYKLYWKQVEGNPGAETDYGYDEKDDSNENDSDED